MQILQRGLADKQSELVESEQRRSQQVYELRRENRANESYLSEQLEDDKQRACDPPIACCTTLSFHRHHAAAFHLLQLILVV